MPIPDARTLKQRILHVYSVRFHMSLILSATVASGMLSSKLLLEAGLHSLRLRYPLAVLASYLVFLGLVRMWIWYVAIRHASIGIPNLDLDLGGLPSSGGGGGGGPFRFGGGTSGGGGASDVWGQNMSASLADAGSSGGSGSGGSSWLPSLDVPDLDLGDDGWIVLLVLAVVIIAIFCAGGYLIYAAPHILPDAACQALIAPALLRMSKEHHHGWMQGVMRSTVVPFLAIVLLAGALGWVAHSHCPAAPRLIDALACPLAPPAPVAEPVQQP